MPTSQVNLEKYEKAVDGIQFLIACCTDDIEREKKKDLPDQNKLSSLKERCQELNQVYRRLRVQSDHVTLPICEKYGAQIRERLASDADTLK